MGEVVDFRASVNEAYAVGAALAVDLIVKLKEGPDKEAAVQVTVDGLLQDISGPMTDETRAELRGFVIELLGFQ